MTGRPRRVSLRIAMTLPEAFHLEAKLRGCLTSPANAKRTERGIRFTQPVTWATFRGYLLNQQMIGAGFTAESAFGALDKQYAALFHELLADACTKISLGGLSKYWRRAGHNHPSISRSGHRYQLPSYSARVQTNRVV